MKLEICWDNKDHTIVRLVLHDNWDWTDFSRINAEIIALMHSTDHTVHLLIDYTQTDTVPMGGVLMHARNIFGAYPDNCDLIILVTRSLLVQRLAGIFQKTFDGGLGSRIYWVATFEEGYYLTRVRA